MNKVCITIIEFPKSSLKFARSYDQTRDYSNCWGWELEDLSLQLERD